MKACNKRISAQSNTTVRSGEDRLKGLAINTFFLFFILTSLTNQVNAQDPQFSQFFAAPLYLNPAFTGTTKEHRFVANYRNQWRNVANGYVTYAFSYDYNMRDARSGFGLMATADKAGAVEMGTKSVGFLYSYKIKLSNNWILTPGLHFAYGSRGIDKDKVVLLDQLSYGDATIASNDPLVFSLKDHDYFDFGSGLLLYSKTFWIGASAFHMNQPNISMISDNSELAMKTSIHGGARIRLYNGPFRRNIVPSIAPSFILKKQGSIEQLDLGVNFHYDPVMFGMWYRGMPSKQNLEEKNISQDALIFLVGMKHKQLEFGYSYDVTLSSLGPTSGGAHEVSLTYHLHNPNRRRPKVKYKDIPCPTFLLDN
ncbi:type IX secretion system PorP/SprF family membrane protein [Catalinimonas alkaloidigena]|uniref:PorP/SprF family type IX secretion system membrane protein n=1 Tax=Catalinimonas alkaloidigena TaxID=1075417 RepID=UPI002405D3FC|nr:type IX secretion system membrane protein PorP/SprF [Catalinimonas alkaloidigena]MDF9798747.1 type IX secretion system PorP/SprF family membrane protein [Catalinimonas alkaloidigena]